MKGKFEALLELIKQPLSQRGSVSTDHSILLVYPPEQELDFRDYLLDKFAPLLRAKGIPHHLLDLSGFLFETLEPAAIEALQEDEFDDYSWMKQGLSKRVEQGMQKRLKELSEELPGGTIIAYATVALYPLIRFGEVLRGLRNLNCRIVIAFPGDERGGKLHFMNQPDGGNYLAVKIT